MLPQARNVTYAASNSAVKASRRARSTLSALIPEPIHTQPYSPDAVSAAAGGGFTGSSGGNRAGLAGRAGAARGVRGGEVGSPHYRDRAAGGGASDGAVGHGGDPEHGSGQLVPYTGAAAGRGAGRAPSSSLAAVGSGSGRRDLLAVSRQWAQEQGPWG